MGVTAALKVALTREVWVLPRRSDLPGYDNFNTQMSTWRSGDEHVPMLR
jgi:hypothetical protein